MLYPELVTVVVASLATYLSLAGESFAKELGKTASEKVGVLYKIIKDKFSKENKDKNLSKTLESFEKKPEEWVGPMKSILTEMIISDPEFSAKIEKLVEEIKNESIKAGTENSFETMVTGGYVGKIINIGTVDGDIDID